MRIRTRDAKMALGLTSNTALAGLLPPNPRTGEAYTKSQVGRWGELLPELQSRQLVERFPELRDYVLDPITGMTIAEMRERARACAAGEERRG